MATTLYLDRLRGNGLLYSPQSGSQSPLFCRANFAAEGLLNTSYQGAGAQIDGVPTLTDPADFGAWLGAKTGTSGTLRIGGGLWVSPPLSSGVTISGTITGQIGMYEDSMSANAYATMVIYHVSTVGNLTVIWSNTNGSELPTSAALQTFSATPTSTAFAVGDRIAVASYASGSTTMNSGYNVQNEWGAAGSVYDGQVTFTETLTFNTTAPAGTVTNLTSALSGLGTNKYTMWTDTEASTLSPSASITSGAAPGIYLTVSGTEAIFYTPPLAAGTVSGQVKIELRLTGSADTTSGLIGYIWRVSQDGTTFQENVSSFRVNEKIGNTATDTVSYASINTTLTAGQRLMIRVAGVLPVGSGSATATGQTVTMSIASGTTNRITWPTTLILDGGIANTAIPAVAWNLISGDSVDFEGGTIGDWSGYNATATASTTEPRTGTYGMEVIPTTTGATGTILTLTGLTSGKTYQVSAWAVRATGTAVNLAFWTGAGGYGPNLSLGVTYSEAKYEWVADDTTQYLYLIDGASSTSQKWRVDDVVVREAPGVATRASSTINFAATATAPIGSGQGSNLIANSYFVDLTGWSAG